MNIDSELLKAQIHSKVEQLRQNKSEDYYHGMLDGIRLISEYLTELEKIYARNQINPYATTDQKEY